MIDNLKISQANVHFKCGVVGNATLNLAQKMPLKLVSHSRG